MPSRDFPVVGTPERLEAVESWYRASLDPDPLRRPETRPVRRASTVMLLRDAGSADPQPGEAIGTAAPGAASPVGIEVVMLKRAATMAFAAHFHAFPGGAVDPGDGPGAAGHLAAAVREVEEECGWRLDPAALRPRARWIGPPVEPRRFDTWIYAAPVSPAWRLESRTTEAESMFWARPADTLAAHARGDLYLMPPTQASLEGLAAYESVAAYLDSTPDLTAVEPELVLTPDGLAMRVRR